MRVKPTYGSKIKFMSHGTVWNSSDRYFNAMPNGVNGVTANMDLVFECDQEDLDLIYEDFYEADGVNQLTFYCPIENFYKGINFFGDELSVESSSGDLFSVKIGGESTMSSPICSSRGQFIDIGNIFSEDPIESRIKKVEGSIIGETIQKNDIIFYEDYNHLNKKTKRLKHAFWDKIFFAGEDFYDFTGREAIISSEEEFESLLTQNLPQKIRKKMAINSTSSAFNIDLAPSFKTRIKSGINQIAWNGIELSFTNLTDQEAFMMACFCEARLGFRSFDLILDSPFDRCSNYIMLSWTHEFVGYNINNIKVEIQPRFRSYKKC